MSVKHLSLYFIALLLSIQSTGAQPNCALELLKVGNSVPSQERSSPTPKLAERIVAWLTGANSEISRPPSKISDSEFNQIRNICGEIIRRFPPEEFVYVGVGRSPTPFMAFFHSLGLQNIYNLPLSSMRNHPKASKLKVWSAQPDFNSALKPAVEQRLFTHLAHFLPEASSFEGKTILLLDYTQTGASLVSAREYIARYYASKGVAVPVSLIALADSIHAEDQVPQMSNYPQIAIPNGPLKFSLRGQLYDAYSEYGKFILGKDNENEGRRANKNYEDLVQEFTQRGAITHIQKIFYEQNNLNPLQSDLREVFSSP